MTASTTNNYNSRRPILPNTLGPINVIQSSQGSHYNGLQAITQMRLSQALLVNAFYTWSKTLSTASVNNNGAATGTAEDFSRMNLEYGRADYDLRNQANMSVIWRPSVSRTLPHPVQLALSRWTLSGIAGIQSGFPFTMYTGVDNNLDGYVNDRPNLTGANLGFGGKSRAQQQTAFFNTAAFCSYTLTSTGCPAGFGSGGLDGTTRRNNYSGPYSRTANAALLRDVALRDGIILQARIDVSNVFNLVNLNNPNATLSSVNFARITGAGAMRQMQAGLHVIF